MKTLSTTKLVSRIPTIFSITLCGLFLAAWFVAKENGVAVLPEEYSGIVVLLFLFSPFQNLRNDIRRSRIRSLVHETGGTVLKMHFRIPYVVTLLPTFVFFLSAVFVVLGGGMESLFLHPVGKDVFLVLSAVSFAVAFLNSWNDCEHATALCASVPPMPLLPTPRSDTTDDASPNWLLPVGRSSWAVVAGYLGLVSFLLLPAPFAFLFGILGLRDIRRNPSLSGKGRAWLGIVAGGVFSAVFVAGYLGLFSKKTI